ncbi:MAG: inositol monophosphatase family protein, partial [Nitrospirales bacterium]
MTDPYTSTAIEAAKAAGRILLDHTRHGFRIEHKNIVTLVTDADRRAEQAIVDVLTRQFPEHEILAEERGLEPDRRSPYRWIIDPLDGT